MNQALGSAIASVAWLTHSRARRITQFNLQHCFPDMDSDERTTMAYESLKHTGRQFAECAWIWHRPVEQIRPLIREICGEHLLRDAVASSRGVIVVSPHIGNWELCALPLSSHDVFTFFYRSPRNPDMQPKILKWRAHLGGEPALLDAGGIRTGMRILKRGGLLGILPDQEPDKDSGVFAPFFNKPALTMTLLSRLATRSNAQLIFMVTERLPRAQGWRLHYLPASEEITSDDPVSAALAVNQGVERCIALCPTQYLWDYKRFNTKPDGTRRRYHKQ